MTVGVGNALSRTFSPRDVTISAGTRVVWSWNDTEPHSTTSDAAPPVWDSNVRTGVGQQFTRTFSDPGTFPYHCTVHGAAGGIGMAGTITVTP